MGKLPDCLSRKQADAWCIDFCNMNNKRSRRRLVKEMFLVRLNRLELLPYYGRIVATLSHVYLDIGSHLAERLERQLRRLIRLKDPKRTESRVKNIRFIGELAKFKVEGMPPEKVFRILALCFKSFINYGAMCVRLFEVAGDIYRTKSTFSRTQHYLQMLMQQKSKAMACAHRDRYGQCILSLRTPQRRRGGAAMYHPKVRSPLEAYVHYLIVDNQVDAKGLWPTFGAPNTLLACSCTYHTWSVPSETCKASCW